MIKAGTSRPAPFDVVMVHSFRRFFRDHPAVASCVRTRARNGVRLFSITQEMGDEPMHRMMRQIIALFDQYQSQENTKHAMRGAKVKKRLELGPLHAETVRLIYRLGREGDGTSGQMGVKNTVSHLQPLSPRRY
jgi:DNA invertase Pin-like site-specific DNA recombinase